MLMFYNVQTTNMTLICKQEIYNNEVIAESKSKLVVTKCHKTV